MKQIINPNLETKEKVSRNKLIKDKNGNINLTWFNNMSEDAYNQGIEPEQLKEDHSKGGYNWWWVKS